jgi:transposase
MYIAAHHTPEHLMQLQRQAVKPTMVLKLRTLVLAHQGWTHKDIAAALGRSPRTIQQWVGDYNRQGLDGLIDRRGGNHRHLDDDQEAQLRLHLDAAADDPHGGVRHAAQLIPVIEEKFGVTYSLSGLYDLLHRLGYSWLSPRPRHEKNDPARIESFKKTPPRSSDRSPTNTPIARSKSGSRTRPASDSRER